MESLLLNKQQLATKVALSKYWTIGILKNILPEKIINKNHSDPNPCHDYG